MEKAPTLRWVLFAVGAFAYRMMQKMRATAAQEARERPRGPAVPALPTATFQELLKQMQARNAAGAGPPALPATGQLPPVPVPNTPGGRPVPVARSQERPAHRPLRRLTSLEAPAAARPGPPTPVVRRGSGRPRAAVAAQADAAQPPFAPAPAAEPSGAHRGRRAPPAGPARQRAGRLRAERNPEPAGVVSASGPAFLAGGPGGGIGGGRARPRREGSSRVPRLEIRATGPAA